MSGLLRKIGRSQLAKLPDGRKQIVDRFEVRSDAGDPANLSTVFIAFGTAHPKYTDCLLTQQPSLDFSGDQRVEQDLIRVYEEMPNDGTLVQAGPVTPVTIDENGVRRFSARCIGLRIGDWTPTPTGTPLTYEGIEYALVGERVEQTDAVRTVYRDYQAATNDLMQLGKDREILRPNGQKGIVRTFFMRAFAAWSRGTHGTALVVGGVNYVLTEEEKTETQAIRTVTQTYLQKGEISRRTQTTESGEERLVIVSFAIAPTTPTGYALELPQVDDAAGALSETPTYTYTFAKATATATQIGLDALDTLRNGQKRLTRALIQTSVTAWTGTTHGTALTVSSVNYVLTEETAPCVNGVRFITQVYLQKGVVAKTSRVHTNSFIVTRVTTFADDTAPTVSGGTLALTETDDEHSATPTRVYTFVSSGGVFSTSIQTRTDGLRSVTVVSMGVKNTPTPGEVVSDEESEDGGLKRWSVTVMQSAAGGAVIGATLAIGRQERFVYPGRVKAFSTTVDTNNILDIYRSPPQAVDMEATATITYSMTKGSPPANLWAPNEGATMRATFQAVPGGVGQLRVMHLENFRAVNASVNITASGSAGDGLSSCFGQRLYGGTTATITLNGGPEDPGGTTKTLAWSSEPAFATVAGTVWYRIVTVAAAIPAQASLPV